MQGSEPWIQCRGVELRVLSVEGSGDGFLSHNFGPWPRIVERCHLELLRHGLVVAKRTTTTTAVALLQILQTLLVLLQRRPQQLRQHCLPA